MPAFRLNVRIVLAIAGLAALGLSACGRAGPLELPPGPAASAQLATPAATPNGTPAPGSSQDTAMKSGFDSHGNPVATQGQKRPFILDPILQ